MAVNFDLPKLIAFRAAAELANLRKAAEAVHISQPAFSRRIGPGPGHTLLVSVPLGDPVVTRRVGLIRRQGRRLSPQAQQLYDFFAAMKKPSRPRAAKARRA